MHASQAWRVAVDTGLVDVPSRRTTATTGAEGDGRGRRRRARQSGTAAPGEDLALVTSGAPGDVLDLWLAALDTVLADAAVPDLDDLVDALDAGGEIDFDRLDWNPGREADFLDGVLANLYLLTVTEGGAADGPVPLPVLAASMVVPDDMGEPTDAVLEQVSDAMMRLDDQFRQLEPIGLVEFRPVDEELMAEADDERPRPARPASAAAADDDEDVSRYGMVRLTPLGLYGIRARMLEAGVDAPAVGELADKGADALLDAVSDYPETAAQAEIEQWLAGRERPTRPPNCWPPPAGTTRAPRCAGCAASRPSRRPGRRPSPRSARCWTTRSSAGSPGSGWPSAGRRTYRRRPETMVFWLTVDTIAAQLAADGETEELPLLMETLTAHHTGFFEQVWRVEHPATATSWRRWAGCTRTRRPRRRPARPRSRRAPGGRDGASRVTRPCDG